MAHGKLFRGFLSFILALSVLFPCLPALGEDEHAENAYPYHIEGNAGSFCVRNGHLMIPDCLVVNAHSTYTAWELNSGYNTQSGFETLFEYLMACEVQPYTMLRDGEYASYFYTGIRIYLQSTIDPDSVAIINLRPTNSPDVSELEYAVDMRIDLYDNYSQGNQGGHTWHEVRLKDIGNLWSQIAHLTLEYYEPDDLRQTTGIEYHSLQNDPSASACPTENPRTLRDSGHIRKIVQILLDAEKMPHLMAASDILHLRFVLNNGDACNVYLQEVTEWNQGRTEPDTLYARMGGYCYKVDRDAMLDALDDAGCPDSMFQA